MSPGRISQELFKEIASAPDFEPYESIASRLGVSVHTVRKARKDAGCKMRDRAAGGAEIARQSRTLKAYSVVIEALLRERPVDGTLLEAISKRREALLAPKPLKSP